MKQKTKLSKDENMVISLRAVRAAWLFMVVFLLVWSIIDFIKTKEIFTPQFIAIIFQNLIFVVAQLILSRKAQSKKQRELDDLSIKHTEKPLK